MADNNYADDEQDQDNEAEQKLSLWGKLRKRFNTTVALLFAVGVLLVALSVTGTLLAVQLLKPDAAPVVGAATVDMPDGAYVTGAEPSETVAADAEVDDQAVDQAEPAEPKKSAIYYPIKPPIIVNFDARGRQRFLQAELALMTRDDDVISAIELHMSMIRNNLLLLIGSHLYEDLQTAEGKELLRQQCLQELQRLMTQEIGKPGIEQVLFTNFVMQ